MVCLCAVLSYTTIRDTTEGEHNADSDGVSQEGPEVPELESGGEEKSM